ncbi:PspC domain-containing protein [Oscillatoria laete-virens NRMC-F 0139]|jgi:phage shock protein PspC (stress-responsive transcriptional regulator)|nr:PspC domain-containing protein [Oscillatoria laete-virens]MDL5054081.1 PspC domain-containing protein [Oscillatoria laete-virens NRMC-F 0139]
MVRSFTDRVFGGVCGGLGSSLRLNAWAVRVVFTALSIISQGAFVVPYIALWWITPQEQPSARRQRRLPVILALLLLALTGAAWIARDQGLLRTETGADLFWPGALGILAVIFFLRQFGGGQR